MFFKRKIEKKIYDPSIKEPAIRVSICTGEKVAGFINRKSERFEEVILINNEKDLQEFIDTYSITGEIKKIY
ncbi:MAG: hypothetical protein IKF80_07040 [Erysipelotrichaceae bacterium]|nr:hypothetical protein [Erysipelotrichaceae bacterium]